MRVPFTYLLLAAAGVIGCGVWVAEKILGRWDS